MLCYDIYIYIYIYIWSYDDDAMTAVMMAMLAMTTIATGSAILAVLLQVTQAQQNMKQPNMSREPAAPLRQDYQNATAQNPAAGSSANQTARSSCL